MQGYNCIMVYNAAGDRLLMCRRKKDPYKGMSNLVGGKIEPGEDGLAAAYRELWEETAITREDIELQHLMDFTYYVQDCYVEIYVGRLHREVEVSGDENELYWSDLEQNFFDLERYAGEGNIGHMVEQVKASWEQNTNRGYPPRQEANELLTWADRQNPGPWVLHSKNVARAAEAIANACGLDGEKAYVLGLLHDIGRYEGWRDLHHIIVGYNLMMEKGYPDVARIAMTHSFPGGGIEIHAGKNDSTAEETQLILRELEHSVRDDYDALIQLCDAIALAEGISLLEVRQMDIVLRYGFKDSTIPKWQKLYSIKDHFEKLAGHSIYDLFRDEVIANSITRG